ncbi:MAG: hypothetical protein HYX68_20950 [Planctomycetes bacterium]|jgi:hypothetical protein|nr:hypothetical protein [Planctomycetota bacterium]
MTAAEFKDIFESAEFKTGLEEISSYLASVRQEAAIVQLLAKVLWRQKRLYVLERNKRHDLTIWTPSSPFGDKETNVEFKIHFECDMKVLADELSKNGNRPLKEMWDLVLAKKISKSWSVMANIYGDFCVKAPHIFVWIIHFRNLRNLRPEARGRVCWAKETMKWLANNPNAATDRTYVNVADDYLARLGRERPLVARPHEVDISTSGDFPSVYHIRVCEFPDASQKTARQEPRPPGH